MNSLFSYRLTTVFGLLAVLTLNALFDFWAGPKLWAWILAVTYLLWIGITRLLSNRAHDRGHHVFIDLLFWSLFFGISEGVSNPLIWCLLLPPLVAAIKQSTHFAWITTFSANLAYLLLWYFQDHINPHAHHHMLQSHVFGMWLGFIAVSLMLTWVITTLMSQLRTKNEAILSLQQQQAEDFNMVKMATLATSLAHELGSPLHSIKLLVQELAYELKDTHHTKECEILDEQVNRCKVVLDELTKMTSRSEASTFQEVNLKNYLEDILSSFKTTQPSIKINNLLPTHIKVLADDLLPLVFLNVINNSIAAQSQNITITAETQQTMIEILVKDDGEGSNHSSKSGMGIGLKLAARIIESMHGKLTFQCNTRGAQTHIKIPQIS